MERFLSIIEELRPKPEEIIDEKKLKFIASKITIWDFYRIPHVTFLAFSKEEKWKMLSEYYQKLVPKYFGTGKILLFFCLILLASFLVFVSVCLLIYLWVIFV